MEENFAIEKVKNGDSSSFKILYDKYHNKLFGYIYCRIKEKTEIEDVMQEVFAKVYKNIEFYDEEKGSFYNFVLKNANQVIVEYFRKNNNFDTKVEKIYLNSNVISDEDMAIIYDTIDGEYNLKSLLDELPESQKVALKLVCLKNLSYKDVARIMNKSELSVKSLIFRAKKTLQKEITEKYPEVAREFSVKKIVRAIAISTVCFGLIGGFSYAAFRLYKDNFYKSTYTVADVYTEVTDDKAISKEMAYEKINEYLTVLGISEPVSMDDLHLYRDYSINEIYWKVQNAEYLMNINAVNGKILMYARFGDNAGDDVEFSEAVLKKLDLADGYDLITDESDGNTRSISYAMKYGDLVNEYQSVEIILEKNMIKTITAMDYDYTDTEVKISKEEAIKIFAENGIDVTEDEIELDIVDVGIEGYNERILGDKNYEELSNDTMYNMELPIKENDIRKVWIYFENEDNRYIVDVNTGEFIEKKIK